MRGAFAAVESLQVEGEVPEVVAVHRTRGDQPRVDDVPAAVSIQEAIVLAEKYGTQESPRFVNGVLDALRKTVEKS